MPYQQPPYNYYTPQTQFSTQPLQVRNALNIKGRPVTSIEEVKATPIDFDGSIFYFPNMAENKIYTKQINRDGTSSILMYNLTPIPEVPKETQNSSMDFVTKDELQKTTNQLIEEINFLKQNLKVVPNEPEFKF